MTALPSACSMVVNRISVAASKLKVLEKLDPPNPSAKSAPPETSAWASIGPSARKLDPGEISLSEHIAVPCATRLGGAEGRLGN